MKKASLIAVSFFIAVISFAQTAPTNKLKLSDGQKITVESTIQIEAVFPMAGQMNSTSTTVNSLQVKNITDKTSTVSNTLTKIKVDMNMMGEANNYDSENKGSNSPDMAKIFDEKLNKTVDVDVDNSTGLAIEQKKTVKAKDTEDGSPVEDLLKMFSNTSDDAVVEAAFALIPAGRSIGDQWSDTIDVKDLKTIRTYTLKSISGNEAVIQLDTKVKGVNMVNFQELEFEIKTDIKTTGEIITDIATGIVKKRTSSSEISGSLQMMGQDMLITGKSNSTMIYK